MKNELITLCHKIENYLKTNPEAVLYNRRDKEIIRTVKWEISNKGIKYWSNSSTRYIIWDGSISDVEDALSYIKDNYIIYKACLTWKNL